MRNALLIDTAAATHSIPKVRSVLGRECQYEVCLEGNVDRSLNASIVCTYRSYTIIK